MRKPSSTKYKVRYISVFLISIAYYTIGFGAVIDYCFEGAQTFGRAWARLTQCSHARPNIWARMGALDSMFPSAPKRLGALGRAWARLGALDSMFPSAPMRAQTLGAVGRAWAHLGALGRTWARLGARFTGSLCKQKSRFSSFEAPCAII